MDKKVRIALCIVLLSSMYAGGAPWYKRLTKPFVATKDKVKKGIASVKKKAPSRRELGRATGKGLWKSGKVVGSVTHPIKAKVHQAWRKIADPGVVQVAKRMKAFKNNPYKDVQASVRVGNDLAEGEKKFLSLRGPVAKRALEQFLGMDLTGKPIPRIAFCVSGGSYRAMVYAIGSLIGADEIGLLDCVSYFASGSGSTWLAPWFITSEPIAAYRENVIPRLNFTMLRPKNQKEIRRIIQALFVKNFARQPRTSVDLYGLLLGNHLLSNFGDDRHRKYLSDMTRQLESGKQMMFIGTAALGTPGGNREWFEFTPYEVGSAWLGMYVPTWSFGRKFENGKSVDFAPEQPLGILMGAFGSAMAADFQTMYDVVKRESGKSSAIVEGILNAEHMGDLSFTSGLFRNFSRGLGSSLLKNKRTLQLVDAGVSINLPVPPLLRPEREVDIMIVLDVADGEKIGLEWARVERYARERGLPFPRIKPEDVGKHTMQVFPDDRPNMPTVIYMPRVQDKALWQRVREKDEFKKYQRHLDSFDMHQCLRKDYCNSANFKYSAFQVYQLTSFAAFNMVVNKDKLVDAIKDVIGRKAGQPLR